MSERLCRFCRRSLVRKQNASRIGTESTEHCPSLNCHWCAECDASKRAGAKP